MNIAAMTIASHRNDWLIFFLFVPNKKKIRGHSCDDHFIPNNICFYTLRIMEERMEMNLNLYHFFCIGIASLDLSLQFF